MRKPIALGIEIEFEFETTPIRIEIPPQNAFDPDSDTDPDPDFNPILSKNRMDNRQVLPYGLRLSIPRTQTYA
jgi:hypothetical protein